MFQPQKRHKPSVGPMVHRRYTVGWLSATAEMSKSCGVHDVSPTSLVFCQTVTQSVPLLLTLTEA